jgi:beta-glucosidase/6-phospho-beta-glucosidase/beta-galactosidase
MKRFIFATGIDGSYPVVQGHLRRDQFAECGHYDRWREDLALVKAQGLQFLRYGPPYYRVHTGPGQYDWGFTDQVFTEMRTLGLVPIVDLIHFGVPDWLENFQNPDVPRYAAEYAGAFARRYPWVQYYTRVNEIYLTAHFSTLVGFWNERLQTDRAFVTAMKHLCQASIQIQQAIMAVQPRAIFIQSESAEYTHFRSGSGEEVADFHNMIRFVALDLHYGHQVQGNILLHLMDNGLTRQEYEWFMCQRAGERAILGLDYYNVNEHIVEDDGVRGPYQETFGWYVIARHYHDRYKKPLMITETNFPDPVEAPNWLWKQWHNAEQMREDGVPIVGFTWYGLLDLVDWCVNNTLTQPKGEIAQSGLYNLDRQPNPVAKAYGDLVRRWNTQPFLKGNPVFVLDENCNHEASGG